MIWFALAAMATAKLLVTESTWSVCLGKVQKNMRQVNPPTYVAAAVFCAVAILSIAFYFHSFPIDENPYASHSVLTSFLFFLAFLGHIVGFYPLSLLIGSLLLISLIVLIIRFPKISQEARPVFFFLLFLLMQMASAAIFRGAVPGHALVARYTVVSLCSFTCFVFLVLDQLPEDWKPLRLLCPLLAFACLGISLTFFAWRGPTFWEEQQIKRRNLLTWPTHIEGLAYPEGRKHEASKILEQLERTKLYNHESARKANEEIPELPSAVSY